MDNLFFLKKNTLKANSTKVGSVNKTGYQIKKQLTLVPVLVLLVIPAYSNGTCGSNRR